MAKAVLYVSSGSPPYCHLVHTPTDCRSWPYRRGSAVHVTSFEYVYRQSSNNLHFKKRSSPLPHSIHHCNLYFFIQQPPPPLHLPHLPLHIQRVRTQHVRHPVNAMVTYVCLKGNDDLLCYLVFLVFLMGIRLV
jgi:hypothetical protein